MTPAAPPSSSPRARTLSHGGPPTLIQSGAAPFWIAVALTGAGAGVGAAALTRLLEAVQGLAWGGSGTNVLAAAWQASAARHLEVLLGAGLLTGVGQLLLVHLTAANGIDIAEAIWFRAGRLPAARTLGSALLSIFVVAMGASLGREGAPKQTGAVIADALSDRAHLADRERRLLVACGAGAGLAAAYGVPLGGALFALEVLRGVLAVRLVLPALVASVVAASLSWIVLPDAPTYSIPAYPSSVASGLWALLAGPMFGLASVAYVRLVAWADRHRPTGRARLVAPILALGAVGAVSIVRPEILGNGKDLTQLAFLGRVGLPLAAVLLFLKPAATLACFGSGAPGGLFTPSLTFGAMLGVILGALGAAVSPAIPIGLCAAIGAGAVLAATTQGPISAVVVLMELTGRDHSFIAPLLVAVTGATLVARSIELRSVYDARLDDDQVAARQRARDQSLE